jgi:hypothetical protein
VSVRIHSYSLLCLLFLALPFGARAGNPGAGDPFLTVIREAVSSIPHYSDRAYVVPTDAELDQWRLAIDLFRADRFDSCRALIAQFNYTLTTVKDAVSGNTFDVFRENVPIKRGWGTLVFNRGALKRLNIHVNHPVDDLNIPVIGAELFRRAGAKWMLIGGSSKRAGEGQTTADLALARRSVFQRWHELVTDATQVSVSLHTYHPEDYPFPISASDMVVSNGRTTDVQWGISQISLSLRDSLRSEGFHTALAMLDSGFARLAGGTNPQGIYSNDTAGFGHWINIELSAEIRNSHADYMRFIRVADRALSVTHKSVAHPGNQAFGLVSPRVVRFGRANTMLFPPPQPEKYRIVSFSPGKSGKDTLDLLLGNWLDTRSNGRGGARIVEYDTTGSISSFSNGATVTRLVTPSPGKFVSGIRPVEHRPADTLAAGDEGEEAREPIQVHRIPLQPVLASTVSPEFEPVLTPFHWGGILPEGFTPQVFTYRSASQPDISGMDIPGLSRFLIPILKSSYQTGGNRFVGVDMTDLLVNEIARLVSEYRVEGREIGMIAEQGEDGDYYLRLFAGNGPELASSSNIP